ncbi:MAG: sialidase family protein [Phycisphaerae bacterium]
MGRYQSAVTATSKAGPRIHVLCLAALVWLATGRGAWGQFGATFSDPAPVNANADADTGDDQNAVVVTDGRGTWRVVWQSNEDLDAIDGDLDVLSALSTNGGSSWSNPVPVYSRAAIDLGDDFGPNLATDGEGTWMTLWTSLDDMGAFIGSDADILFSTSLDASQDWSATQVVNVEASAVITWSDQNPSLASDGQGTWVAVWDSDADLTGVPAGLDTDILVSRSSNNGVNWTPTFALNHVASADSGDDRTPVVVTDGAGRWIAVWSSTESLGAFGADGDIAWAVSSDDGATWTDADFLNGNAMADSADDEMPSLATDGQGNWVAVWVSAGDSGTLGEDADILLARSSDNGDSWTDPVAVKSNAATDASQDDRPVVATDGGGNWVVVWESDDDLAGAGSDFDILAARSTDNGANWTAPVTVNNTAGTDSTDDRAPSMAADGNGQWIVVWESVDGDGGDTDIVRAQFILGDCNSNGVGDAEDIAGGASTDCDANGIPDECDVAGSGAADCNANGLPDACDPDADDDGVPDDCDNCPADANAEQTDTDGDGAGDACDAGDGGSGGGGSTGGGDDGGPDSTVGPAGGGGGGGGSCGAGGCGAGTLTAFPLIALGLARRRRARRLI